LVMAQHLQILAVAGSGLIPSHHISLAKPIQAFRMVTRTQP